MTYQWRLHTCPRRGENFPWTRDDLRNREHTNLDSWRSPSASASVTICSFCASMHPDEFMDGLRARTLVAGPTDKDYKAYVLRSTGRHVARFYYQHFSSAQMLEFIDLYNQRDDSENRLMLVRLPRTLLLSAVLHGGSSQRVVTDALQSFRYDTDREVHVGEWLVAAPKRPHSPERFWRIVAVRLVKNRGPIPHRYRWAITCERRPAPTDECPYLPEGFPVDPEEIHSISFYKREPRHRWRQYAS